jgi:ABC-type glutathione transport system ATPase component
MRKRIQIVFQDPDSSLNPSMTVARSLSRTLRQFFHLDRAAERERIAALLRRVGLDPALAARLPRELSGGQKQRVAIARALAAEPDLLVCDEITSSLDAVVQASMLELLRELRRTTGMAMLFISHELGAVRAVSDRVVIMRHGSVVEAGDTEAVYDHPAADYTRSLLDAAPALGLDDYPARERAHA